MHETADFRSDTVTKPTPAMRRAMAEAEVGDDVLGHDPTVARLEETAAALFGKAAAAFVPSGTMGNAILIGSQAGPGEEIVAEEWAHTINFEVGGAGALFGLLTRTLRSDRGAMDPDEVARWIRPGDLHTPRTALVTVENTHNFHGGAIVPLENLREIRRITWERGVRLHLDGARIWNACAATGIAPAEYGELCDSISVCLSKGLGAPVGSVAISDAGTVERARRLRKRLGGGMRQSGVLAAAGLVAIGEMRDRIPEDHANARRLAEGLTRLDGLEVDAAEVETNILFVRTVSRKAEEVVFALGAEGVLALATGEDRIRFVTHPDVDAEDVDRALDALARYFG
jgi:threonine aldolase